ncbi:MAG: hypothetical protein WKF75_03095 [Singulisphaera sp.]
MNEFLPPGDHPLDDLEGWSKEETVDGHVYLLGTNLVWASAHLDRFKHTRETSPQEAEEELAQLGIDLEQAFGHFERLEQILRHGYWVSPRPLKG